MNNDLNNSNLEIKRVEQNHLQYQQQENRNKAIEKSKDSSSSDAVVDLARKIIKTGVNPTGDLIDTGMDSVGK